MRLELVVAGIGMGIGMVERGGVAGPPGHGHGPVLVRHLPCLDQIGAQCRHEPDRFLCLS